MKILIHKGPKREQPQTLREKMYFKFKLKEKETKDWSWAFFFLISKNIVNIKLIMSLKTTFWWIILISLLESKLADYLALSLCQNHRIRGLLEKCTLDHEANMETLHNEIRERAVSDARWRQIQQALNQSVSITIIGAK